MHLAGQTALDGAAAVGLPRLAAQFGPALLYKAVADAALQAAGLGWCDGVRAGVLGDPHALRLRWPARPDAVWVRHTVGLADRLTAAEPGPDPADGLPATLADAITRHGLRRFKLKLSGDLKRDRHKLARLRRRGTSVRVRVDANNLWSEASECIDHLREIGSPAFAIEEPVQAHDLAGCSSRNLPAPSGTRPWFCAR